MRELVDAFYEERSIVNHQIASYNDFLEQRLQNIVDSTIIGHEEEMERGFIYPEIEGYKIKFGKISVGKPAVKEADGTVRKLTPMEARLRDLTYEAPLVLEFIPVKEEVEYDPEEVRAFFQDFAAPIIMKIVQLPKPVIAAVNGPAYGGGCEIAMLCDLVVASEEATFAVPETRIGAIPPVAAVMGSFLIGKLNISMMILTGEPVTAEEAKRMGLVN